MNKENKMKKGTLSLLGTAATALSLSACVVLEWEISYPGADKHVSEYHELVADNDGNIIALVEIKNSNQVASQTIIKYSRQGELLWEQTVPHVFNFDYFFGNDFLAVTPSNSIIAAGIEYGEGNKLSLLNTNGDIQWTKIFSAEGENPALLVDVEAGPNDSVLALGLLPEYSAIAYNSAGDELWRNDGGLRLDHFAVPRPAALWGELAANNSGDIYFSNGSAINKLDQNGTTVGRIETNDLGVAYIRDIAVGNNSIAVLSQGVNHTQVDLLDNDLNVIVSHSIDFYLQSGMISISSNESVCYATQAGDQMGDTHVTGKLTSNGLAWEQQNENQRNHRELARVNAVQEECRVSTIEADGIYGAISFTRIHDNTGKLTDTVEIKEFAGWTTLHIGNEIISGGFGQSDEQDHIARLYKHKVQ